VLGGWLPRPEKDTARIVVQVHVQDSLPEEHRANIVTNTLIAVYQRGGRRILAQYERQCNPYENRFSSQLVRR
jgi:hypothetical protein